MSEEDEDFLRKLNLKTILVLIGLLASVCTSAGTWYVSQHRLETLEENVKHHSLILERPMFTVDDYNEREMSFRREMTLQFSSITNEMAKRQKTLDEVSSVLVSLRENQADMNATLREVKTLLLELRK